MPFTLTMPKLSPTMEEGTIAKWHVKVGEHVNAGDLLFEVSTDKATVEYNALDEGWLRKILIGEGGAAHVNQAVAIFTEEQSESIEGYKPKEEYQQQAAVLTTDEKAKESKAPQQELAPGSVKASPSQVLFTPEAPLENYQFEYPKEMLEKRVLASPLAKRLAKEKNLDLTTVKGTGPNGRIMSKDLDTAQSLGDVVFGSRSTPELAPGSYYEEDLSPMRKAIGKRLQDSKTFIPHFYVKQTVEAELLASTREQLKNSGLNISINDFIVRAVALTLRKHPIINSGYNSANQTVVRFQTIDIAVAVSISGGLITPIIRHADYKSLGQISTEVRYLAKLAREGKLEPDQYKGGSFTISNLGMYGVVDFQAIINPPQAAILAVSAIQDAPVVKNGQVAASKTMNITLSVDHRVIDGAAAAEFLKSLKNALENPAVLLVS